MLRIEEPPFVLNRLGDPVGFIGFVEFVGSVGFVGPRRSARRLASRLVRTLDAKTLDIVSQRLDERYPLVSALPRPLNELWFRRLDDALWLVGNGSNPVVLSGDLDRGQRHQL